MSRELRRVPRDWDHPKDARGKCIPMRDHTYEEALAEWKEEGWGEEDKPVKDGYRPAYTSPADCYQVYEDVSEGTPLSPVLYTVDEVIGWLLGQGYSRNAATKFCKAGWAPSMVVKFRDGKMQMWTDINAFDVPEETQ